jgi:hypothetical protein
MKTTRIFCAGAALILAVFTAAGSQTPVTRTIVTSPLEFESSLPALDRAFAWAKDQALAYAFTRDPVGDWYEAALPRRQAFCMRDVSHQATGANALGLQAFNKNMLHKFAAAISEAKDWCSYWEINREDKPAPVDYRNDKEFWYNLPANFDVLDAVARQYLWTGDRAYLDDPAFLSFAERTVKDYVERWALAPDAIMTRPVIMNLAVPLDPKDPYRVSRGLPSYNEDGSGMNVGADLPAAQYAGYRAYALLRRERGDAAEADAFEKRAAELKAFFHRTWWDAAAGSYFLSHYPDGRFRHGAIQDFLLYFGITAEGEPTRQAVRETAERREINIEQRSYYPEILFRHGQDAAALRTILYLCAPSTERREYPEVSFAVIGALARGLMGIEPDARDGSVATLPRLSGDLERAEMRNVPVLTTSVSVTHKGARRTVFKNTGSAPVVWKAAFRGRFKTLVIDGRPEACAVERGEDGGERSFIRLTVVPGRAAEAAAVGEAR